MASLSQNSDGSWNFGTKTYASYSDAKNAQSQYEKGLLNLFFGGKSTTATSPLFSFIWLIIRLAIFIAILTWCSEHIFAVVLIVSIVLALFIYTQVQKHNAKKVSSNWETIASYPEDERDYNVIIPLLVENDKKYHDLESTFLLYLIYNNGTGVPQDSEKALAYLEKAAKNGHIEGCLDYGLYLILKKENSTEEDQKKGFNYIKRAARSKNDDAVYQLAMAYYHGGGTPVNEEKAIKILTKLSKKGYPAAEEFLKNINKEK